MEDMILIVIRALAVLGEKGVHSLLDTANNAIVASPNAIDNELFTLVINSIKSYEVPNS